MEIKQLRSFIAVVEYGNFTKAAEKTFTSQPTVSTHVKALEDELNTRLIIRDTKNISVTKKGMELYDTAVKIIKLRDKLVESWENEDKKIIRIGASTIPSAYILPSLVGSYSKSHLDTSLIISQGDSSQVVDGLENGIYDIGFLGTDCSSAGIKCDPIFHDKLVIAAPRTPEYVQLAAQSAVPYDVLMKKPFILREPGSGTKKASDDMISSLGYDPSDLNCIACINDMSAIKNMVERGVGLTFINRIAVEKEFEDKKLTLFPIDSKDAERNFYIAVRKDVLKGSAVKSFVRFVKKTFFPVN